MKYIVMRASLHDYHIKPCQEAKRETINRLDIRTVNDPAKIAHYGYKSDWWYAEGENHRVEKGQIVREFPDEAWFVELNTLDDLMKFYAKYGSFIIEPSWLDHRIPMIRIYDDYVE